MPSCVLCVGGWEPPMVSGKAESERGQGPVCGIPGLACPGAGWRGGLGSAALVGGQGESGCLSMGSVAEGRGLLGPLSPPGGLVPSVLTCLFLVLSRPAGEEGGRAGLRGTFPPR